MCDYTSEVAFGLLNHHINVHSESLSNIQNKCLRCGKTFAWEVMISFQFIKHLKSECNEIQKIPINEGKTQVTNGKKDCCQRYNF